MPSLAARPATPTQTTSVFSAEALTPRLRFGGKAIIGSEQLEGLRTLFRGTRLPKEASLTRWAISGAVGLGLFWSGLRVSLSPSLPAILSWNLFAASAAGFLVMFIQSSRLLRAPRSALERYRFGRFYSLRRMAAIAGLLVTPLIAGGLLYGRQLAASNYLGNQSQTVMAGPPTFLVDPESERLIRALDLFDDFAAPDRRMYVDQLRHYVDRFPLEARHRILVALQDAKHTPGAFDFIGVLSRYPGPDNVLSMIEFLETGILFHYQSRYMRRPIRMPGQMTQSPEEAQAIWKEMTGQPYDVAYILRNAFSKRAFFAKNIGGDGSEVAWNVSELVQKLARANIPSAVKLDYAHWVQKQDTVKVPKQEDFEQAWAGLSALTLQPGAVRGRAMAVAGEFYRRGFYPNLNERVLQHYGGWRRLLSMPAAEVIRAGGELSRFTQMIFSFRLVEGEPVLFPAFMDGWTVEEFREFSDGMNVLNRGNVWTSPWPRIIMNMARGGTPISPQLPRQLQDPSVWAKIIDQRLNSLEFTGDTLTLRTTRDYERLAGLWNALKLSEKISEGNNRVALLAGRIRAIDFSHFSDRRELITIADLARREEEALRALIVDRGIASVVRGNFSDFANRRPTRQEMHRWLIDLAIRRTLYGSDKVRYAAYRQTMQEVAGLNRDWEDYLSELGEEDLILISPVIEAIKTVDPERANRLTASYVSRNFARFAEFEGMEDLVAIEETRLRMNRLTPALGDGFLVTLTRNFLQKTPVNSANLNRMLALARKWKFYAPQTGADVEEFYGLIAYFIGNHVQRYLQQRPAERTPESASVLTSIGIVSADTLPRPGQSLNKLAIYVVQGDWQYLLSKTLGSSVPSGDGETHLRPAPDFPMTDGFQAMKVVNRKGAEVAHLFIGDQQQGARAALAFDVGFQAGGVSADKFQKENSQDELVGDLPVNFTTGFGKPTELAIEKGEVQNWLMSMDRAHGLVIVYADGTLHIADKRLLFLHELYRDHSQMAAADRRLDLSNLDDYLLFLDVARAEGLSATANMLLINRGVATLINDKQDSRRLLLQFTDGRYAILNMSVNSSTGEATQIAKSLRLENGATVRMAVYCDTGYYDYFTVRTQKGAVVLGHSDRPSSSGRLFLFRRRTATSSQAQPRDKRAMRSSA